MKVSKPKETEEQKQARQRAEADNLREMQQSVQDRTQMFRRLRSPRVSIATGKTISGSGLM